MSCSILRRKLRHNFTFPEIFACFKNLFFQQPLRCYRNNFMTNTAFVRKPLRSLQIVHWCLSYWIRREKIGQILLSLERQHFFEKIGSRLLRSWRNDEFACTILVKIPSGPLYFVHWHLSCSILREKVGQIFLHWKYCLFSKVYVSNNFLVLMNWSSYFLSTCHKNLVNSSKLLPEVCHARYYQKKRFKNFCHSKNSYFLKCLFLSTP